MSTNNDNTNAGRVSAHTPGPWHIESYPRFVGLTVVSKNSPVCAVSTGPLDRTAPRMPAEANARLIAAAPELLAALELVYANAAESPEWIRSRIAPAIAKATGNA